MEITNLSNKLNGLEHVFGSNFLDERVCRQWILRKLHGDRPSCPSCGFRIEPGRLERFFNCGRIECPDCGRSFNCLSGTPLANCPLKFADMVMMFVGFQWGLSNVEISSIVGIHRTAVMKWRAKWISE